MKSRSDWKKSFDVTPHDGTDGGHVDLEVVSDKISGELLGSSYAIEYAYLTEKSEDLPEKRDPVSSSLVDLELHLEVPHAKVHLLEAELRELIRTYQIPWGVNAARSKAGA